MFKAKILYTAISWDFTKYQRKRICCNKFCTWLTHCSHIFSFMKQSKNLLRCCKEIYVLLGEPMGFFISCHVFLKCLSTRWCALAMLGICNSLKNSLFYLSVKSFISTVLMENKSFISLGKASDSKFLHRDQLSISASAESAHSRMQHNIWLLCFQHFCGWSIAIVALSVKKYWRDADRPSMQFHSVLFWEESCTSPVPSTHIAMKDDIDKQDLYLRLKALSRRQK